MVDVADPDSDDFFGNVQVDPNDTAIPIFSWQAKRDTQAEREARDAGEGENVVRYKNIPWVEILIPGDNRTQVSRPMQDKDKERWPRQWANFIAKGQGMADGVPLEECPLLDPAQVAMFKHYNVPTCEAVAGLSDQAFQTMGAGVRDLAAKVAAWLKGQSQRGRQLADENAELRADLVAAQARIDELSNKIDELIGAPAPETKGGRPRTAKPEAATDDPGE